MDHYIGAYRFLEMAGDVPMPPSAQLEVHERNGADGVGVWETGKRGRQFTIHTCNTAQSLAKAEEKFRDYLALKEEDPQDFTFRGIEMTDYQVQVLDVRATELRALPPNATVGGHWEDAPHRGWLECDWTLIAILIPDE